MNEYHYAVEEAVLGPLSVAELGLAMRRGELPRETQVTGDAGNSWQALSEMLVAEEWPAPLPSKRRKIVLLPSPLPSPPPAAKATATVPVTARMGWVDARGLLSVWLGVSACVLACLPVFGLAAVIPGLAGLLLGLSIYRQCRVFSLLGTGLNGMAILAALLQGAVVSVLLRVVSK